MKQLHIFGMPYYKLIDMLGTEHLQIKQTQKQLFIRVTHTFMCDSLSYSLSQKHLIFVPPAARRILIPTQTSIQHLTASHSALIV